MIDHLPRLGRPAATALCVHPWDDETVERVRARLARAGLEPGAEWFASVKGRLPAFTDLLAYRRFHGDRRAEAELRAEWEQTRTAEGFPILERRYLWLARLP